MGYIYSRKGQVGMIEMIMVLVVVILILVIGIFYYSRFYLADIEKTESGFQKAFLYEAIKYVEPYEKWLSIEFFRGISQHYCCRRADILVSAARYRHPVNDVSGVFDKPDVLVLGFLEGELDLFLPGDVGVEPVPGNAVVRQPLGNRLSEKPSFGTAWAQNPVFAAPGRHFFSGLRQ